MRFVNAILIAIAVLGLTGCNTDPSTNVRQPMTIRPNPAAPAAQADGAIYHASNSRPLFEDRRARFVGDTLTVALVEKTSSNRKQDASFGRSGSSNLAIGTPTILGYTPKKLSRPNVPGISGTTSTANLDTSFTATSDTSSTIKDSDTNSNAISGTITVTVIEVLPNGNLVVSGEKQLAINEGTEFVRLSGVVNPINITSANTVSSTLLADARIESKQSQRMDSSQIISMLSRFFVALLPF